jgi:hypothetical protein
MQALNWHAVGRPLIYYTMLHNYQTFISAVFISVLNKRRVTLNAEELCNNSYRLTQEVAVEWLALPHHIHEVPGSNHDSENTYSKLFRGFPLSLLTNAGKAT